MRGMLLVVIYEDAGEPQRLIFVNEEFDNLYGDASYCTTPEEATAWAPITGPAIDTSKVVNATLITVAPGASPNEGELIFNGQTWANVWNFAGATEIGIDERDVKPHLQSTDNEAGFQSSADWMEASNAFLVVEYKMPDLVITEKSEALEDGTFTVTYTVANVGDGDAGASDTTIYIDGTAVMEDHVPALAAAGESYTNTVGPFDCPCGTTITVTVCADNDDVVEECNEENNCMENELECLVEAGVRIEPETLNLNSKGKFTAFITLPEPYDVADVDVSTVECEGAPAIEGKIIHGKDTLRVKFNREDLRDDLPTGDNVTMTVTGALTDETLFEGSDTIRVIAKGK